MPVTNFDYRGMSSLPDVGSVLGINNIHSLLNDDDDFPPSSMGHRHTSSDANEILRAETTIDDFPVLVRRSDAVNATMGQQDATKYASANDASANWSPFASRHRQGQQSLPLNVLRGEEPENSHMATHSRTGSIYDTPPRQNGSNRRSIEVNFSPLSQISARAAQGGHANSDAPGAGQGLPGLQRSSLSTNDLPTISSLNGFGHSASAANLTHAEQHLHNHNATIGRIPPAAKRHSREVSIGRDLHLEKQASTQFTPGLPSNGGAYSSQNGISSNIATSQASSAMSQGYQAPSAAMSNGQYSYYPSSYALSPTMGPLHGGAPAQWFGSPVQNGRQFNQAPFTLPHGHDNQHHFMQQRKLQDRDGMFDVPRGITVK
jgi:hypothetical protein